ncbi:MAG TPA: hypothetical protein DG048_09745 [Pseudoalteromonas sp.]|nr:hypothetical protein [Pseudoalteromonas sp.]
MGKNKSKESLMTQVQEPHIEFIVEGRPKPKGRPRMTRRGRVYTPAETIEAEELYAETVKDKYEPIDGPVSVVLTFGKDNTYVHISSVKEWKSPLRGDLDNYIKLALDGIQRAGLIANDKQVVHIDAIKV